MTNETGWNLDNSYARLPEKFFTSTNPTPVRSPELVILNESLAGTLGLDVKKLQGEDGVAVFAGNEVPEGASPLAQAYAGHQFGHFNMLGDGRAILLGEQVLPEGERVDIQRRVQEERRTPAGAMAGLHLDRCCANTSSARRCTDSAFLPPEVWLS